MDRGFFKILAAQFFSALADNALFFAAFVLLKQQAAPAWHSSMLLWCFTVSYVLIAPYAGAFADAIPKRDAMMICNGIKLIGCLGLLFGMTPLFAYALVGFGAAAYSPAKYGLITEYLPAEQLVAANGWLEGATVCAIVFGTLIGGYLTGEHARQCIGSYTQSINPTHFAIGLISTLYFIAAGLNRTIPYVNICLKPFHFSPRHQLREFNWCLQRLWRDPEGQISLAITTLFWGAGATMRLVVLNWSVLWLGLSLENATQLIALVAIGIAIGAVMAGRWVPLDKAFSVMPAGIGMGTLLICMLWVNQISLAALLMLLIGILSGFFVVPLNAILQHRGQTLMGAGHSIAVQNFNENLGILVMVGIHALMVKYMSSPMPSLSSELVQTHYAISGIPPMSQIILGFGWMVIVVMALIMRTHHRRSINP